MIVGAILVFVPLLFNLTLWLWRRSISSQGCCCCSTSQSTRSEEHPAGFHTRGGNKLHYEVVNPDSSVPLRGTVLLLHGMLTSGRYWRRLTSVLAGQGYRCIVPDLLGFGRSPWPRGGCTVEAHVQHLEAMLAEVFLNKHDNDTDDEGIILVGHSFGSLVAFEFARFLNAKQRHGQDAVPQTLSTLSTLLTASSSSPLLSATSPQAPTRRTPRAKGVALLAMPFYNEPGRASKGLKHTPKGCFVYGLVNFPGLAYVLCTLICQQRCLWLPLIRGLWAVVAAATAMIPGQSSPAEAPNTDATLDAIEDFMLHSFYSCMETFEAINQHSVLSVPRRDPTEETFAIDIPSEREAGSPASTPERTQTHARNTSVVDTVAILLVHGARDDIVPVECSRAFAELLQRRGLLAAPLFLQTIQGRSPVLAEKPGAPRAEEPAALPAAAKFKVQLEVLPEAGHALVSHPEHAPATIGAIERWICEI